MVGALVIALATAVVTVNRPIPERNGAVVVPGLSGDVEVLRDSRGVPRIYADQVEDLFLGQGYVHAQDRFFQMDLQRHVTAGRLSELVGEDPTALGVDVLARTLGWRRVAEAELAQLDPDTRRYLDAYAEGVNAYLSERSPGSLSLAYPLLGLAVPQEEIEPWTAVDSLAWLKAVAWQLNSNYEAELDRAVLLSRGEPPQRVSQLFPPYDPTERRPIIPADEATDERSVRARTPLAARQGAPGGPGSAAALGEAGIAESGVEAALTESGVEAALAEPGVEAALAATTAVLHQQPELLAAGGRLGSNSWVVSGEHTASGAPILANDPHAGPESPSVWYQVGLHCRTVGEACPYDVSGVSFAGLPGVVAGHNADIAWGLAHLYADQSDFVLERVVEGQYEVDGELRPVMERTEVIEIAGVEPVEHVVRETRNGPILSDIEPALARLGRDYPRQPGAPRGEDGYAVTLRWVALEPSRTMQALLAIGASRDWDELVAASQLLDVPAQSIVYADTSGRTGYLAAGRIPVRGAGNGRLPALGWDSGHDWQGYLAPEQLPAVLDPAQGYLVAANQLVVDSPLGQSLGADTAYGYRSQRIDDLLSLAVATGGIGVESTRELQLDDLNPFAATMLPYLRDVDGLDDFTLEAVALFDGWDGSQPAESAAAAYYNAVFAEVLALTFTDELPEEAWPDGDDRWFAVMERLLEDPNSEWWDDARTLDVVETRDGILSRALVEARLELTRRLSKDPESWQWGQLHSLEVRHIPLGGEEVPEPVRALFNLGRVPLSGGSAAVNATFWSASTGSFNAVSVPTARLVSDLGDVDRSRWVDLTGVSGHPFDAYHGNQLDAWVDGRLYSWPFTRRAVVEASGDRLLLQPPESG